MKVVACVTLLGALAMTLAGVAPSVASNAVAPCTETTIRGLVRDFTRSFNRADWRRVDRKWSRFDFKWFGEGQAEPQVSHFVDDRRQLIPFFKARHAAGERFRFAALRMGRGTIPRRGDFGYTVYRRADDLRGGETVRYIGKAAAYCSPTPLLFVWSMTSVP